MARDQSCTLNMKRKKTTLPEPSADMDQCCQQISSSYFCSEYGVDIFVSNDEDDGDLNLDSTELFLNTFYSS